MRSAIPEALLKIKNCYTQKRSSRFAWRDTRKKRKSGRQPTKKRNEKLNLYGDERDQIFPSMAKHKFGNPFETRRRWVNTAATALRVSRQRAASTQRREVQLNAGINFNRNNSLTLSVTVRKLLVSSAGVSRLYM